MNKTRTESSNGARNKRSTEAWIEAITEVYTEARTESKNGARNEKKTEGRTGAWMASIQGTESS